MRHLPRRTYSIRIAMYLAPIYLMCLCLSVDVVDENNNYASGDLGARIVEWVQAFEPTGFSGAVLAAKDGQVVAAVGVGYADQSKALQADSDVDTNRIRPSALFELASCSKPITALSMMRLVEQKKCNLDDSIAKYLPGVPTSCQGITIRHLLQHSSGIPGTNFEHGGNNLAETIAKYLEGGPKQAPGSQFEYWNQGYALLSAIIANGAGHDDLEFTRREIFHTIGMNSTCFTGDNAPPSSMVTVGRSLASGEHRSALDHPYGAYDLRYRGMGGVVSNVWDLWRMNVALDGTDILSEASKKEVFSPGSGDYAFGWHVRHQNGRLVQFHSGMVDAFVCYIARYPESKSFIVVLCNRDDSNPLGMAADIEGLLFEGTVKTKLPPKAVPESLRRALVGRYRSSTGAIATVELDGPVTKLFIEWAPPNGPGTHGTFGVNAQGDLVLAERYEVTEVRMQRDSSTENIIGLDFGNLLFKREP